MINFIPNSVIIELLFIPQISAHVYIEMILRMICVVPQKAFFCSCEMLKKFTYMIFGNHPYHTRCSSLYSFGLTVKTIFQASDAELKNIRYPLYPS